MPGHGCLAREVALRVAQQRVRSAQVDDVLPHAPGRPLAAGRPAIARAGVIEQDRRSLRQRGELLHPQPEQIAPGRRVPAQPDPVGRVHNPGESDGSTIPEKKLISTVPPSAAKRRTLSAPASVTR